LGNPEIGSAADQIFQAIFPLISDGLLIQNGNAEITSVNPAAESMLGMVAAELVGQSWDVVRLKLIGEDGLAFPRHDFPAAVTARSGTPRRDAVVGLDRADGTRVWLAVSSQPLAVDGLAAPYPVATILRDITGRKRMEQAVAAREQEYRSLAENSPDSIIRYDYSGRMLYLNRGLLNYFGLSADEVIGKLPREVWQDGRYAEIDRAIARVQETGNPATVEFCGADAAGKLNFNQVHIVPERDVDGQIIGAIGYGRDVTAIREAERQLKHFIMNLPGMAYTYRLSPDGHASFPFISPAVEKFYGLKPEDVQGDIAPLHNFWHPADRPYIEAAAAESARTMQPFRTEARVCRPGQPERWLEARALPEREADGGTLWYGLMLDITGRKQAEEALRASEQRMRLFFERQLVGMAITSPEKGWLQVNDKLCEMLGYVRGELARLSWAELTHPDDLAADTAQFERMLGGEIDSYTLEKRFLRKDGGIVFTELAVGCVRREDLSVDYVLAMLEDITERKQAERERQVHARSLECMERVNKAIQETTDLEQMMRDVLDVVLASFDCDRAFLLYPGAPAEGAWQVPMERTRPEYPGALALGLNAIPMDQESAQVVTGLLDAAGPVIFAPGAGQPLPANSAEQFGFKSQMLMAVHPKRDQPWIFGIHQCSHAKIWSEDEEALFQKIGWRLSDALTSLLMYRDLRASEEKFRSLAENMPFVLVRYDREGRRTFVNPSAEQHFGVTGEQMLGKTLPETNPLRITTVDAYQRALQHTLTTGERSEFEMQVSVASGEVRTGNTVIVAERAADGRISGAITIGRDITQLKQAERQLRELAAHIQTVREEELARLAREIHDDLGSTLAALNLKISLLLDFELPDEMKNTPLSARLESLPPLIDNAVKSMRRIISGMRPDALDNLGLFAALKWQAEQFDKHSGIECQIVCVREHDCQDCKSCEYELGEKQSINLFRIFQEALTNVARHSGATQVRAEFRPSREEIVLSVSDNGCGIAAGKVVSPASYGMRGMRERVGQLGGQIDFEKSDAGGLRVKVRLPQPAKGSATIVNSGGMS
jgi:PAS domain S-box-containing protein